MVEETELGVNIYIYIFVNREGREGRENTQKFGARAFRRTDR